MSYYDDDYFEPGEWDETIEGFKDDLRKTVKAEISEEIDSLRRKNLELGEQVKNLNTLEGEARRAKTNYEMELERAQRTARQMVQKEGLRHLLNILREERYKVQHNGVMGPKCDKCDEGRMRPYETPSGREMTEGCECREMTWTYEVEEVLVHEVTKRNGKIMVWYSGVERLFDNDDFFQFKAVLKSPEGVSMDDLKLQSGDYGFTDKAEAQKVADALNEATR